MRNVTIEEMRSNPRNAGAIKRYHEHPTVQTQTNAEHSWNVQRIFLTIFATFTEANGYGKVLRYILFHDSGELGTGDLPFPVKAHNPVIKKEMDRLEEESLFRQKIELPSLTPWEKTAVKVADLIEMCEFGNEEVRRGSAYGQAIVDATLSAIRDHLRRDVLSPHDKMNVKSFILKSVGVQL